MSYSSEELVIRWEEFFDEGDYAGRITSIADAYPEDRSLYVDYVEVERFDSDLAIYLMEHPQNAIYAAEQAIKQFIPPTEEAEIHFRVKGIPRDLRVEVRDLRAKHLGRLISVEGLVRKATEVRPRLVEAVFQCLRCGAIIKEVQEGMAFREPLECYQDQGGCTRTPGSTKFQLLDEGSRFVDTQKIEIQEPPEELRGGEQPQRLVAYVEDDLTGKMYPGDRVVLNGILRSVQRGRFSSRSTLFDIFLDVVSVEMEQVEYEEIEITEEDEKRIREEAASGDIIRKIVGSIAPSIYGLEVEKEALALQLFGGVPKELPDGRRVRGDIHILLVGDPGVAKSELLTYMTRLSPRGIYASGKAATAAGLCVSGDTIIHSLEGLQRIESIVRRKLQHPVDRPSARPLAEAVYALDGGSLTTKVSLYGWRMPVMECYKVITTYGKELVASPDTRLLTCGEGGLEWKRIADIRAGDLVAAPVYSHVIRKDPPVMDFMCFDDERVKLSDDSRELLRTRLLRRYGTLRKAARRLGLSEGFIYNTLLRRYVPYTKLVRILHATKTLPDEIEIEGVMLRDGKPLRLPTKFDAELMYLIGVTFGDGDIRLTPKNGVVRITNSDVQFLRYLSALFQKLFGRPPRLERQEGRVPCLKLNSKTAARFFKNVGMRTQEVSLRLHPSLTTSRHADAFIRGLMDTGVCIINRRKRGVDGIQFSTISRELARQVQLMLGTYGIKAGIRLGNVRGSHPSGGHQKMEAKAPQYNLQICGKDVETYVEKIGFGFRAKTQGLQGIVEGSMRTNQNVLPLRSLLANTGDRASERWVYLDTRRNPTRRSRRRAEDVLLSEVAWERVVSIEKVAQRELYDLTVPGTHNFVANGLIVHNTAAAVKDEFGEGRWTLEAGALVLGDLGLVGIDEIEKMSDQDRSSIHTAMEQQTVHIAKAGITATLQTRCAILAAANPTLGRFDERKFIAEQIQLPPTLLSRFDAIFPIMDRPRAEHDKAMAEHILKGHLVGEKAQHAKVQKQEFKEGDAEQAFLPYFEPSFLRKYVAYAKRIYPVMTPEAMRILQEKYLEIRRQGETDGGAVPITPRQLEAFIRLAEASARARLSDVVTEEDAQRSVRIIEYWLQKVTGVEGTFDIDIVATGVSQSQRNQMIALREIIEELCERDGMADIKDILEMAEERGIPPSRVEAWLKRWSQEGEVYSPARNKWKLVGRF